MARRFVPAEIALMVIDAVLIVALVALLLTQPDGAPEASEGSSSSSAGEATETETDTPSSTQAVTPPEGALDLAEFATPTGNIWCTLTDTSATCEIATIDYQPPPIDGCDDNDLAGKVLTVSAEGAEYPCPDGDIAGAAPDDRAVLDYESVTAVGDSMCTSMETGVTCTNLSTGASFTLTRRGPSIDNV